MINIPCESDALKNTYILVYLPKKDTKKRLPVYSNPFAKKKIPKSRDTKKTTKIPKKQNVI